MFSTYWLNRFFWNSIDWLFPPVCGGCSRVGFRWCPECRQKSHIIVGPVCEICGIPLSRPGICQECKMTRPNFEIMRSWLIFDGPIRQALHQLKYRRNIALGDTLAIYLADFNQSLHWQADMVIPVPLGRLRLKERGYNQVGLIANALAQITHLSYKPRALIRIRETKSQVGLSISEREANVADAFLADQRKVAGASILLIDDVATTGATLSACAKALLDADAILVKALTIARALPRHGLNII